MVIGIICRNCSAFVSEQYPHKFDTPTFFCRNCNLILEVPTGMRRSTAFTEHARVAELADAADSKPAGKP